jgi:CheY-like chemotaxis protein
MASLLVVEDNADTRDILAKSLEVEGYTVLTAEDGREGLQLAESRRPDLIIADLCMPNVNGVEMIEMLRKQPRFNRVPILVLTAYGSEAVKHAIEEMGASVAVSKPVDFSYLLNVVEELLKQTAATFACSSKLVS